MGTCGLFSIRSRKMVSAAERQATVFHQRVAAGEYDAIYDAAAPAFGVSLTRPDSAKFFAAINAKMGVCKMPAGAASYLTSGRTVQLRYRLECAHGTLDETMLYVETGDAARLAGYDAKSPTMVIR
jgi:hypothetical protein